MFFLGLSRMVKVMQDLCGPSARPSPMNAVSYLLCLRVVPSHLIICLFIETDLREMKRQTNQFVLRRLTNIRWVDRRVVLHLISSSHVFSLSRSILVIDLWSQVGMMLPVCVICMDKCGCQRKVGGQVRNDRGDLLACRLRRMNVRFQRSDRMLSLTGPRVTTLLSVKRDSNSHYFSHFLSSLSFSNSAFFRVVVKVREGPWLWWRSPMFS